MLCRINAGVFDLLTSGMWIDAGLPVKGQDMTSQLMLFNTGKPTTCHDLLSTPFEPSEVVSDIGRNFASCLFWQ